VDGPYAHNVDHQEPIFTLTKLLKAL